ncbi:2'-5' RNA ligase family protein [Neolewinella antarctica]|uniref:2'-5' RNA ligase family protein n=1 Tax=Neolewinella antarctica TaxID=442734 RepID=A0ABX0XH07_9BACT|nr:2'-5' RNA ligase family protein [Neolewinella antarctica]NJC28501.1 hypothetical protein [Neolewinella antarctica]
MVNLPPPSQTAGTIPRSTRMHPKKPKDQRATIVTAWVRETDMVPFHRMRQAFFPGHRNYLSAHVTLFHHLKPAVRDAAISFAETFSWSDHLPLENGVLPVDVTGVLSLGKGTAFALAPTELLRVRQPLHDAFADSLTPQDARPWKRPHITVQNKVDKEVASRLQRRLGPRFTPCTLRVVGLRFWRYDYGPWGLLREVEF